MGRSSCKAGITCAVNHFMLITLGSLMFSKKLMTEIMSVRPLMMKTMLFLLTDGKDLLLLTC